MKTDTTTTAIKWKKTTPVKSYETAGRVSACGRFRITRHEYDLPRCCVIWNLYDDGVLVDKCESLTEARESASDILNG